MASPTEKDIRLGRPSAAWDFGQDRRMGMIRRHTPLEGRRALDVGCGIGFYTRRLQEAGAEAYGVDVDPDKVAKAREAVANVQVAPAEKLPFPDGFFDMVLSHEVLEHVDDDRQAVAEAIRVLKPGGRLVIFVPNRLYPFETHGCYWRGRYRFGNIPLVNWLPNRLRNRLCPHVRAYTARGLVRLWEGLPCRVVVFTQIYPGYDKIASRRPWLGRLLRTVTYALERTPLRAFGLSHFVVLEKTG
ncbi:MAG: methyltransferase domain-containing protein [Anaerolineae bacterium]|jgi:SAM-dependent methyltransferase|nr:methyltransferase domain-containing protein [Anaerolineae bacterium]